MTKTMTRLPLCGSIELTVKSSDKNWYRLYLTETRTMSKGRQEKSEIYLGAETGKILTDRLLKAVSRITAEPQPEYTRIEGRDMLYALALSETYTSLYLSAPPAEMIYLISRDCFEAEKAEHGSPEITLPYIIKLPCSMNALARWAENMQKNL